MKAALLLAVLVLAAPLAAAHLETYNQAVPIAIGPYSAIVEPFPQPVFENTNLMLRALFTRLDTGAYATNVTVTLDLQYPNGTNETRPLNPDGRGYFLTNLVVRHRGDHVARVTVKDAAGEYSNATNVTVYPDAAVRLRAADPDAPEPVVGQEYPLAVLTFDNVTGGLTDKLTDMTLRVEHWTDDHGTLLGSEEVVLNRTEKARWGARHVFEEKGMYHLRFASSSGGFNYDDIPLLHIYANDPVPARQPPAPTDAGRDAPLGLGVVLAAVVLAGVLLRRR